MVGYTFQNGFIRPILLREKTGTIRLPRKRHARPGEGVQHFNGPRMRPTRIGGSICEAARQVRLDFDADRVEHDEAFLTEGDEALNAFAIADGFRPPEHIQIAPWEYLSRWWRHTHPGQPVFVGVHVTWGQSFTPHVPEPAVAEAVPAASVAA